MYVKPFGITVKKAIKKSKDEKGRLEGYKNRVEVGPKSEM
jgi:hypothetical protein